MPELDIAAPAQPVTPTPISAGRDAANKGDFSAFDKADQAARSGKPLPDVPATPAPAAPVAPPAPTEEARSVSKRQQQINDYERRIAEQNERIARLEGRLAPAREPAAAAPPVTQPPTVAEWKRIAQLADAPKLTDKNPDGSDVFTSVEEHSAAMALFVHQHLAHQAHSRADQEASDAAQLERHTSFQTRLTEAVTADPEFVGKLSPEVKALKPISGLGKDEPSGPLNVLWEHVYDSPQLGALLLHFSQHPEDLRRFETLPASLAKLPPGSRARAHIPWIVKEFGKLEAQLEARSPAAPADAAVVVPSTITQAPPPAPILTTPGSSSDPQAAAAKRGDFATWDKLEMAKERAKRGV